MTELVDEPMELRRIDRRDMDHEPHIEVPRGAPLTCHTLATDAQGGAALRPRRHLDRDWTVEGRHFDFAPFDRLAHANGDLDVEVVPFTTEERVRSHVNDEHEIPRRTSVGRRASLPRDADATALVRPRRNADGDRLVGVRVSKLKLRAPYRRLEVDRDLLLEVVSLDRTTTTPEDLVEILSFKMLSTTGTAEEVLEVDSPAASATEAVTETVAAFTLPRLVSASLLGVEALP